MEKANKEKKQKKVFIIIATVIMMTLVISSVMHIRWISFLILGGMLLFCGVFFKSQSDKKTTILIISAGSLIVLATLSAEIMSAFTEISKKQMIQLYFGFMITGLSIPLIIKSIQIIILKKTCDIKKQVTCTGYNMKLRKRKLYKQPIYKDKKDCYIRDNFSCMLNPRENTQVTVYVSEEGKIFDIKYNLIMLMIYITCSIGFILLGIKYIIVNF